ncbi:hypothetical protein COV81_02420 [Candidatus Peregrinibacteria bacterium CG11_big_fil_rev_8_21_14_0_20_41_10]|nr:MAG: hypothetical protein COV81_02420 [Candidatus Peregrinibacteria bacterium CG11_big_fil_rev_8_21_14_0_20_41_10]
MASATEVQTGGADEAVVAVATTVSPEVQVALGQVVLSKGEVGVSKLLHARRREVLASVLRLLAAAGIQGTFSLPEAENASVVDVEIAQSGDGLSSEKVEIDARLMSLVVEPINALSEAQRTLQGVVRSGEEIARAIPDVAAFLNAVSLRKDGEFFELNKAGQLVMADGCPEAYGLGDDFPAAKMRQSCIWYLDEQGVTQSLQGEELYTVKEVDGKEFGARGKVQVLELTNAAKKVVPTMASGLPTLKWDGERHTGEYARMNTGQLERSRGTWIDDNSLDCSRARNAAWLVYYGSVNSIVYGSNARAGDLGSRGVLRVNLNFES